MRCFSFIALVAGLATACVAPRSDVPASASAPADMAPLGQARLALASRCDLVTGLPGAPLVWGGDGAEAAAIGDLDDDGKSDVAVANIYGSSVTVVSGLGGGLYGSSVAYATTEEPIRVILADVDGHNGQDLIVLSSPFHWTGEAPPTLDEQLPGTINVLLRKADGTFAAHVDYATGKTPTAIAAGDFDGDSKVDLAVTNGPEGTLSVFRNHGDGRGKHRLRVWCGRLIGCRG